LAPEDLTVLPGHGHAVVVEVQVDRAPVLPSGAAVLRGHAEVVLVGLLPEQVTRLGQDLRDHEHRGFARVRLLAGDLADETEALLAPVVRADVLHRGLDVEQMLQLRHVETRPQDLQPLDQLRSHGLPDGEAWMLARIDERDAHALTGQTHGTDRAGEAGPQDHHVTLLDRSGLLVRLNRPYPTVHDCQLLNNARSRTHLCRRLS